MSDRKNVVLSPDVVEAQKDIIEQIFQINEAFYRLCGVRKKAFIETYGCQQNVSDSEILAGMLSSMGYELSDSKDEADFIIYNTCAVRENAELKVYGNLGALKHKKSKNPGLIIGVCGCMMQQKEVADTIRRKYKHVDLVFGTHSLYYFPSLLKQVLDDSSRVVDVRETDGSIAENYPVVRGDGPCAWVSVMYGCNNFCSYCIVPYVRGRERSREKDAVLCEIRSLAAAGYKEITLLGQNVNSYGKDLYSDYDFSDLLSDACKIDGIERIRFMTSHPKDISDKLIDTMAANDKICKQLHLPVQAGNNRVLEVMNRRYTKEGYLEKIKKIKEKMPGITLTTDIIVGFPGETKEEFEDTLDVLRKVRYDTIFSFIYSKRAGTPAAVMDDVLTHEEKKECFDRLLEVQDEISLEKNEALRGKVMKVLVEGTSKTDENVLSGRTEGGKIVNFEGDSKYIGEFADVEITDVRTWSLIGKIID
ncbi:MAG: tRNA (N6-isopentenyl adenosine(37)-C2)-methylthiotransferase MiaB [Clostridia bacterium]|nr:tRNA (N6-isopentenyl adenosine(37)-C2)-methylthiotransferase MiaB [Clostridia bacterium]